MTYQTKISQTDLFGRFFLGIPEAQHFAGYYGALDQLFPLLQDDDFAKYQSGYFVNSCNESKGLRLSYFTQPNTTNKLVQIVEDFIQQTALKEVASRENPHSANLSTEYGGQQHELRFRKYLSLETEIGIEVLRSNPKHAKSLMTTYRWQVFAIRSPIQNHLEPTLVRYSDTYNSLSESQCQQFWEDLSFWPNPPQYDWAHFLINLVLSVDWPALLKTPPFTPLSIKQINDAILPELGFTIDPNWTPVPL